MRIHKHPFGEYQTNCYILSFEDGEIIIDPGKNSHTWIAQTCKNPLVILNTHGHFDHIWDNAKLKELYPHIPLICHQDDAFMLQSDCFNLGLTPCPPDETITAKHSTQEITIQNHKVLFSHYPGHTPGCCIIEIDNHIFSGDFIFYRSIGRSDFAYSNPQEMKESLQRFSTFARDLPMHPGHGEDTSVKAEQNHLHLWIDRL